MSLLARVRHGKSRALVICPHCHRPGGIRTKKKTHTAIDGSKLSLGCLTLGLSAFIVGLHRKVIEIRCHCAHCGMTWRA